MAWVDIGTRAELVDGSTVRGWAHFEYDNASGTTTRPCRIRIEARSGYTFNVMFRNITVAGTNYGTVGSVTQNSGVIWSANITAGGNVTATWENPWYAGTKYPSISGNLPSGATRPSGSYITYNSCTDSSINATTGVATWGGQSGTFELLVITGSYNGDAVNITAPNGGGRHVYRVSSGGAMSTTKTMRQDNVTVDFDGPIDIKGMLCYKLGCWNWNSIGNSARIEADPRYLPPSKPSISYSDQGSNTFRITFTNTAADNHSTYDAASLTRTLRYKVDTGAWISIIDHSTALIDDVTTFDIPLPAGSTATAEGWMTYHGMDSEKTSIQFSNAASPNTLYGSVNNRAEKIVKLYGSVNGQAKEVTKLYGSVNGVAKKIYEA